MFARNTNGASRNGAGIFARKWEIPGAFRGLGRVEVVGYAAPRNDAPSASRARRCRRAALRADCSFGYRIFVADRPDYLHRREVTRDARRSWLAPRDVILFKRGLDGVEGDGADDKDGHEVRGQGSGVRSQGVSGAGDRGATREVLLIPTHPLTPDS